MARGQGMDRNIFAQATSIDDQKRHFVLGVELQIVRRHLLVFTKIERANVELCAGFGERDVGNERTGIGGIVENDLHERAPGKDSGTAIR
jgi:hypothetical protein